MKLSKLRYLVKWLDISPIVYFKSFFPPVMLNLESLFWITNYFTLLTLTHIIEYEI